MSGDGGKFTAMNVNGTNWTYKDGAMAEGTEAWGDRKQNQGALTLGTNVLQIDDIIGGNISISNVLSSGRGTIAGIQVVDTYEGTYLYRTLDSTGGAWSDALWSETDGTAGTLAWGGAGNGAVLKADAGGSTLTLSGTVVSDGVILQSGKLILSGGTLNMTGPAAFVTGSSSTIKFDGTTVTSSGTLVLSGTGTYEISDLSYLPLSVNLTGGTLNVSGDTTVGDGRNIWIGSNATFDAQSVTISSGGSVSVANVGTFKATSLTIEQGGTVSINQSFSDALKVDSFSGNGELVLATAMGFNKDTLPGVHEFLKDFSGTLTLGAPAEYFFNYSGADMDSNLTLGKDGMTIHVTKGATFRINHKTAGSNTFGNKFILDAGSTFRKEDGRPLIFSGDILMNGNDTESINLMGYWGGPKETRFTGKISGQGKVQIYDNWASEKFSLYNPENDFSGLWQIATSSGKEITLELSADAMSKASVEIGGKGELYINTANASVIGLSGTDPAGKITSATAGNTLAIQSGSYAGSIGNNLNLNKTGTDALTLSGDLSAFNGSMTVSSGDLTLTNYTGSGQLIVNGGKLVLGGTGELNQSSTVAAGATLVINDGTRKLYISSNKAFDSGTIEIKENAIFRTTSKWKHHLTFGTESTLKGAGTFRFDVPETDTQNDGFRNLTLQGSTSGFTGTLELLGTDWDENQKAYRTRLYLDSADGVFGGIIKTVGISKTSGGDSSVIDENVTPNPVQIIVQKNMSVGGFEGKGGQITSDQASGIDLTVGNGDDHVFGGSVGANVNVIKVGAGSQTFSGDMSSFNGTWEAGNGILDLSEARNLSNGLASYKLSGGELRASFDLLAGSTLSTTGVSAGSLTGNMTLAGGTVVVLNDTSAPQYVIHGDLTLGAGDGTKLVLDLTDLASLEARATSYEFKLFQSDNAPVSLTLNDIETVGLIVDSSSRDSLTFGTDTSSGNIVTMALTKAETVTLTWNGSGSLWETKNDASSWKADDASVDTSFHTGDRIVFAETDGNTTVTITGTVKPQSMSVTGGDYIFNAGTDGTIAGSSALTMTGGSLTMNLANAGWDGAIDVTDSELKFGEQSLGTGRITLHDGAVLTWLAGNGEDISSRLAWEEDAAISLGVAGESDEVTFGTSAAHAAHITKLGDGTLTLNAAGRLSGTIAVGTTEKAGGTLKLSGGGSGGGAFKGDISVINGTLLMAAVDVTGWNSNNALNTSGIRVEEQGRVQVDARQTFFKLLLTLKGGTVTGTAGFDLFGNGASVVTEASDRQAEITTAIGLRQNDTVFNIADGASAVDLLVSGTIKNNVDANAAGNHNFIKQGDGYLKITGSYDATGSVTVQQGTLEFNSGSDVKASGLSIGGEAVILMNGMAANGSSYGGALSGYDGSAGTLEVAAGRKLSLTGNSASFGGTLQLDENSSLVLTGNMGAADLCGSGSIVVNGGETVISGGNDGASLFGGTVSITGGTLRAGSDTGLGANDITLTGGTLDINGKSLANRIVVSGGIMTGTDNSSVGDVVVSKNFSMAGSLSAASLAIDSGVTVSSANLTSRGNMTMGRGALLSTTGTLTLTGGTSLNLTALNLTRDDASIAVIGTLAVTGDSPVSINLGDDFMSNQISEGNYAILSATGGLDLSQFEAGTSLDGTLWSEISDVYQFELALSDDRTSLFLHASIDNNKAWQWIGVPSGTWSNGSALEWKDKDTGPEGKAVFFGAETPQDQTVQIDESGVNPIFVQIQSNAAYTFTGGAISDYTGNGNTKPTSLMMAGTGIAVFRNANTFTGDITLTKGTLIMQNAAALGNGGTIFFNDGTLEFGAGSTDVSSRFAVNNGKDLKLAVSQDVDIALSGLSDDLTGKTDLLLEKSGAGNLSLTQNFAGSIHITDASTEEAGIRIRRSDSGGSLTLQGAAYHSVEVDALDTLIIDGQTDDTVTLDVPTLGTGSVLLRNGKTLVLASDGALTNKLELCDGSSLSLAGGENTLSGDISVKTSDGQAAIHANGSLVALSGTIRGVSPALRSITFSDNLLLDDGTFDFSAGTVEDSVHLILGNGTDAAAIDLGTDEDKSLRIAGLTANEASSVSGIEGQKLELVDAELKGSLLGGFTVNVAGDDALPGASVILQDGFSAESGISFLVSGGTLDLGNLSLQNAITVTSGTLAQASNWDGGSEVTVDTSAGASDIVLGGLKASALTHVTTGAGTTVSDIGHGTVALATARLTLDTPNTLTYKPSTGSLTGDGIAVLKFGTTPDGAEDGDAISLRDGTRMIISLGDDLKDNVLENFSFSFDKDELLPDYAEPGDKVNSLLFTITNGILDFDASRVDFDPLLKIWGLKIAGIEGGSIIANGNLSVWQASKEGNVTGYDDLVDYRAVYVNRDMSITLPGSDSEPLTVKYLSGQKGTTLAIDSDGTGTARVRFYNDRDKDGELVDSVLAGNLTAGEHTALSKTGEATLTIGGTATLGGSLTVEEGGIALTRVGAAHSIAALSIGRDGTLALTGAKSVLEAGALDEASGSILLGGDSTLKLASGAAIAGTVKALGGAAGSGTLELGAGTTTLTAAGALDGIALVTGDATRLVLDTPDTSATLTAWNGLGTLAGEGSLTLTGKASYAGTLADFGGTLAASGRDASLTLAGTGSKAAALAASGGGSLTLDYTSGDATYSGLTLTGGSTATLIAGNGDGTNNTLTLRRGGTVSGDSTLGFILNTEASGSLSSTTPLVTTGGRETLDIAEGATVRLAAGDGQEVIHGTMPLQIALASKVSQQGGINLVFDELFGKYFDPSQSRVETVEGTMILTTAANRNGFYVHQAQSETARSGGALMDNALVTVNPQTTDRDSTLAALLNAVDASIKAHDRAGASRTMAAAAGSTVTSLLGSLQADYRYQQTLVRNRMTTMGLPDGYSYEGDLPLWNTWLQATGTYNRLNTDGDEAGYQYNTWGGTFGVDANLSSKFTAGLAMTASYGKLTSTAADSLSGDMEVYYVNLFGRYQSGKWGHNVILTTGWSQSDIDRTVPCGSGSYTGHGTPGGQVWGAMYEGTYDISLNEENSAILQPLVNVSILKSSVDDYTEEGAGSAGLRAGGMDATTGTVSAGVRWMGLTGGNLFGRESLAEVRAQVSQDFGDTRNEAQVGFVGAPGFSRGVKGSKAGTTGLQFGAGLSIPTGDRGTIFVEANADLRSRMTSANGSIGYRYNF